MKSRAVELVKNSVNNLNDVKMSDQVENLVRRAVGKTCRQWGWSGQMSKIDHIPSANGHSYTVALTFRKKQKRVRENSEQVFDQQFGDICRRLFAYGRSIGFNPKEQQESAEVAELIKTEKTTGAQVLASDIKLPVDYSPFFKHLYDRESQIEVSYQSIRSAVASEFERRSAILLYGPPGCGKSEILLAFQAMLGADNCLKVDATTMTKAGLELELLQCDQIPRFIFLEELEKCNPLNLPALLSIMDKRGTISRMNARQGHIQREAKSLILATVNDYALFKSLMSGALHSRFPIRIACGRPSMEILRRILVREVEAMKGNKAWIKPALAFLGEEKTNDPRRAISILDGGDTLLDGSYQQHLRKIREVAQAEGLEG